MAYYAKTKVIEFKVYFIYTSQLVILLLFIRVIGCDDCSSFCIVNTNVSMNYEIPHKQEEFIMAHTFWHLLPKLQ